MDDRHDTRKHDTGYQHLFTHPGWSTTSSAASCRRNGSAGSIPAPSNAATAAPPRTGRRAPWSGGCRWQGGSDWVYLLLKPQSEPEPAPRWALELDRGLLYRALLRRRRGVRFCACPLSCRWSLQRGAARNAFPSERRELFLPLVPALQRYVSSTATWSRTPRRQTARSPGTAGKDNLVSLLCAFERSRTASPTSTPWNGWPSCSPWRGTIRCAAPGAASSAARSSPAGSRPVRGPPGRRCASVNAQPEDPPIRDPFHDGLQKSPAARDLAGFRAWAVSPRFPERGRRLPGRRPRGGHQPRGPADPQPGQIRIAAVSLNSW